MSGRVTLLQYDRNAFGPQYYTRDCEFVSFRRNVAAVVISPQP